MLSLVLLCALLCLASLSEAGPAGFHGVAMAKLPRSKQIRQARQAPIPAAIGIQKTPILRLMGRAIRNGGADEEAMSALCDLGRTMTAYIDAISTVLDLNGGQPQVCRVPVQSRSLGPN